MFENTGFNQDNNYWMDDKMIIGNFGIFESMREVASITLSSWIVSELQRVDEKNTLVLLSELNSNISVLQSLLVGYHYAEAGQVCNLIIKENSIFFHDLVDLSGAFTVEYETHYFMACSDNRYDMVNKMVIDFTIDSEEGIINLQGEEIRERTPDSY